MSSLDFAVREEEMPLLEWDIRADKATGVLAFVCDLAQFKILILPPGLVAKTETRWTARMIDEDPYSSRCQEVLFARESEIEVIEAVEDYLVVQNRRDKELASALRKLKAAGLVMASPEKVAASFVGTQSTTAQRIAAYLNGYPGPAGVPGLDEDRYDPEQVESILVAHGVSDEHAKHTVSRLNDLREG